METRWCPQPHEWPLSLWAEGQGGDLGIVTAALGGSAALPVWRSLPQSVTHSHLFGWWGGKHAALVFWGWPQLSLQHLDLQERAVGHLLSSMHQTSRKHAEPIPSRGYRKTSVSRICQCTSPADKLDKCKGPVLLVTAMPTSQMVFLHHEAIAWRLVKIESDIKCG